MEILGERLLFEISLANAAAINESRRKKYVDSLTSENVSADAYR